MATLADLQGMKAALETARFNGLSSVSYDGRTMTYKSDAEMKTALLDLERRIKAAGAAPSSPFVCFSTSKGL